MLFTILLLLDFRQFQSIILLVWYQLTILIFLHRLTTPYLIYLTWSNQAG